MFPWSLAMKLNVLINHFTGKKLLHDKSSDMRMYNQFTPHKQIIFHFHNFANKEYKCYMTFI